MKVPVDVTYGVIKKLPRRKVGSISRKTYTLVQRYLHVLWTGFLKEARTAPHLKFHVM
jgi:hypothetical protein